MLHYSITTLGLPESGWTLTRELIAEEGLLVSPLLPGFHFRLTV